MTPLHSAASFRHENTVQFLLYAGGDICALDNAGDTPLAKAAHGGKRAVVQLFLNTATTISLPDECIFCWSFPGISISGSVASQR